MGAGRCPSSGEGRGPAFTRDYAPEDLERRHDWDLETTPRRRRRRQWHDHPPTLVAESSFSAEDDDDEENERLTAARDRGRMYSVVLQHPQEVELPRQESVGIIQSTWTRRWLLGRSSERGAYLR